MTTGNGGTRLTGFSNDITKALAAAAGGMLLSGLVGGLSAGVVAGIVASMLPKMLDLMQKHFLQKGENDD